MAALDRRPSQHIDKATAHELAELGKDILFAWEDADGDAVRLKTLIGYVIPGMRTAVSKLG